MINSISEETKKATFESLERQAAEYLPADSLSSLREAYDFSREIYGSKKLTDKELILDHHLEVASIIAFMRLDLETIQAALIGGTIGSDIQIDFG